MANDERKLVHAKDLPVSIGGAPPPPKRNSAEVTKFAEFANVTVGRASRIMESKDGRTMRAIAEALGPEISSYLKSQIGPLQTRITDLANEVSQLRDEVRGDVKVTKTIKTRRDEKGQLIAEVIKSDGTTRSLAYKGVWSEGREYAAGIFARIAVLCGLVSPRHRAGLDQIILGNWRQKGDAMERTRDDRARSF